MDIFDERLLDALQGNGRLTNQELAGMVGLSPSQCSRRRAALEESGIIAGYTALLSAKALGLDLLVFVEVSLARHASTDADAFLDVLDGLDEVQEAYSLTGEADYLLKLAVRDLDSLSRIFNEVLLPQTGVARLKSSIVLDRLKQTTRLPTGS